MNNNLPQHQEVDFLPSEYRHQHARRRHFGQQVLIGAAVIGLLALAAGGQAWWRQRVRRELAELAPHYDRAMAQTAELGKLQTELQVAQTEAQLLTYLRHPWPCTQLLAALLAPLPETITFREIRISREASKGPGIIDRTPRLDRQAQEQLLAKLPRAGRDLKALRDQFDRAATQVSLSGFASDSDAVYRYLGELGKNRLLAKVDLVSLDNASTASNRREDRLEFKLSLLVRPGYGLPDGPAAPPPEASAARAPRKGGAL